MLRRCMVSLIALCAILWMSAGLSSAQGFGPDPTLDALWVANDPGYSGPTGGQFWYNIGWHQTLNVQIGNFINSAPSTGNHATGLRWLLEVKVTAQTLHYRGGGFTTLGATYNFPLRFVNWGDTDNYFTWIPFDVFISGYKADHPSTTEGHDTEISSFDITYLVNFYALDGTTPPMGEDGNILPYVVNGLRKISTLTYDYTFTNPF